MRPAPDPPRTARYLFDRVYNTKYYWINPRPMPPSYQRLVDEPYRFAVRRTMYVFPQSLDDTANGVAFSSYSALEPTRGQHDSGYRSSEHCHWSLGNYLTEDALRIRRRTVHYRMVASTSGSMDVTMGGDSLHLV